MKKIYIDIFWRLFLDDCPFYTTYHDSERRFFHFVFGSASFRLGLPGEEVKKLPEVQNKTDRFVAVGCE